MRYLLLSIGWFSMSALLLANPRIATKWTKIDGLPARLMSVGGVNPNLMVDGSAIDLAPAMKSLGCSIEQGETLIYYALEGVLIGNLSEENHKIIDYLIETFYRSDNLIITCRAYLDLLEALSGEERLKVVRQVGFLPDPLVSSMIQKYRSLLDTDWLSSPLSEEKKKEVQELDKTTLELLDIALGRLKLQMAVVGIPKTEQGGTDQPATAPESKSESIEKPQTESEPAPR